MSLACTSDLLKYPWTSDAGWFNGLGKNAPCSQGYATPRTHEMPQKKTCPTPSALALCTTCSVRRAAKAWKAGVFLSSFCAFFVTSYWFYMLWRKGLEEPINDFWKYLLSIDRQWRKIDFCILLIVSHLMTCLNGRSQSLGFLWKYCPGFFW